MARWPGWLEKLRQVNARAVQKRTAAWSLGFSVLFLSAALLWARLPSARPVARHFWTMLLLVLAVHDFATGLRRVARDRELPPWTWAFATALYAALGLAAAIGVTLLRR